MKCFAFTGALALLFSASMLNAQSEEPTPQNWQHLDLSEDGYPGMSTLKAYRELLAGRKSQTVIVAVIDSGVDYNHEDLKSIMWVNEDEIPGNGKDDDNNGYIDDIHGWNFIGGRDGNNIGAENLEIVRLYREGRARFEGVDVDKLSKSARREYDAYKEYETIIMDKRKSLESRVGQYTRMMEMMDALVKTVGKEPAKISAEDVEKYKEADGNVGKAANFVAGVMADGETFESLYGQVKGGYDYFNDSYNANWNPDFDARHIVGDDPKNTDDRNYGNNDVQGPDASHGTHVSGIIAAARGNNVGMDGVADNVRIMSIRAVPNGDERDKDVANAIIYAVDNGATVINMSFGKGYSPEKSAVDAAVRYAVEHDVLLVHAAGNDGKENDWENNFPHDRFAKKGIFRPKYASTWMEIGAMSAHNDENLPADFSNYSSELVDVFAPGVEVYSTVPDNGYDSYQGTSMAAPMVAGLAALLRSYFPDLTAEQVKEIIMDSSVKPSISTVIEPGSEDKRVPFSSLSVTGGVANTNNAVQMAIRTPGKRKKAAARDAALTPRA